MNRMNSALCAALTLMSVLLQVCVVFATPQIEQLTDQRKNVIINALLAERWDAEAIGRPGNEGAEKALESLNQEQLWQGNVPKFDMRFLSLTIDFLGKGRDGKPEKVSMVIDATDRVLEIRHSLAVSPQFRGGVRFDSNNEKKINRQFLLGVGSTSAFVFSPYWRSGNDLHLLVCPRNLKHTAGSDLELRTESMIPQSLLWQVAGRLKALLFSGSAAGSIKATIEVSDAIAPAREEFDTARGINPVADLVYQPISDHKPAPFPQHGDSNQAFLMQLDMQLPAGYQRKIVEGFSLFVSQVTVPATDVWLPMDTVLESGAASAVPKEMRYVNGQKGFKAHLQSGGCTLIVAERRATKKVFSDKETVLP